MGLWDEKKKDFETKKTELETELKELKERDKGQKVQVISYSVQSSRDSLSQATSQVSLKELVIPGLKNQNKTLEDIAIKREQERKAMENKCNELVDKNNKLTKQVIRQLALQGTKHII